MGRARRERQREQRERETHLGLRLVVVAIFALSGIAALIDQVVWTRWLNLSLGSSSYAAIVVLATFMAGLGAGSWLAGRIGDRRPGRDLLLFAGAEAAIGLWSLFSILLVGRWLPEWASSLAAAQDLPALPLVYRGFLAAICLALPTLAMGATLPLLSRWALTVGGLPGQDVGLLYTLNTLGGGAGALLAALWLIESFGLARSVAFAGTVDIAVALLAGLLVISRTGAPRGESAARDAGGAGRAELEILPWALAGASAGFFASGLIGLGLEVVSHRVLAVLAGSSAYAFATMLTAFLVGIALGSLVGARLADRSALPGRWLALGLAGLTLGIGVARRALDGGAFRGGGKVLAEMLGMGAWSYGTELAGSFLALLPATLMLGFVVPFVARIAGHVPERMARRFGMAYALNTVGAVVGTLLAGLWAIPRLGSAGALTLLALVGVMAALVVSFTCISPAARKMTLAGVVAIAAVGLLLGVGTDPVRHGLLGRFSGDRVLDFEEGPVQTIAVLEEDNPQQLEFLRLITNQTSLTGTHLYARRYMRLLGHLPVVYARTPERALVICLGTGMTAAAVATHPEIQQLDIAEISPEVVHAAPLFAGVSHGVLGDPRTRLLVDDGRHILLAAARPWDLITLEPPPPRDSGVVSLYTTDFYELCRRRLRPGGILAQWIPLHSQSKQEVLMLIRSFLDAFPHVLGFLPVERDLILLGSSDPLALPPGILEQRLAPEAVRASLGEIGFESGPALLATALLSKAKLEQLSAKAPAVTDDRPRVEYFARYGRRPPLPSVASWLDAPPRLDALLAAPPPSRWTGTFATARKALSALLGAAYAGEAGRRSQSEQLTLRALALRPADAYIQWAAGVSDEHLARLRRRAESDPESPAGWRMLAIKLADRGFVDEAAANYRKALQLDRDDAETLLAAGDFMMGKGGRPALGRQILIHLLQVAPGHPAAPAIRRLLGGSPPPPPRR